MRVKDCKGCVHCFRATWVQHYKPANYHEIAFTHAYAACKYHRKRCSEIKWCNDYKEEPIDGGAYDAHLDCYG